MSDISETAPEFSEERTLHVSRSGFGDVNSALAWAVQAHDREFATATMVRINVEQHMRLTDDGGRYVWTAAVNGMTEFAPVEGAFA